MTLLLPAGLLAAASPTPSPPAYESPDFDLGAGPGLLVLVAFVFLTAAIYLIWRGLNKHLAKIGDDDDGDSAAPGAGGRASGEAASPVARD